MLEDRAELGPRRPVECDLWTLDHAHVQTRPKGEGSKRDLTPRESHSKLLSELHLVSWRPAVAEERHSEGECR